METVLLLIDGVTILRSVPARDQTSPLFVNWIVVGVGGTSSVIVWKPGPVGGILKEVEND